MARCYGEVDIGNADGLHEQVNAAAVGSRGVVVDLSEVEYLDSTALSMLHRVFMASVQVERPVRVVAPDDSFTRRLLAIVGFDGRIGIDGSVDEALVRLTKVTRP